MPTYLTKTVMNMSKTLKVIEPFFNLEYGDVLTLDEDGKNYFIEQNEKFDHANASGSDISSSFMSKFTISVDYAKELIKQEMLEEVDETKQGFVNVFDEINNLLYTYTEQMSKIDTTKPACLQVEEKTVLENLITVLTHLKNLKK